MIRRALVLCFAVFFYAPVAPLHAEPPAGAETRYWDKTPIAISLPVGEERMISFPGDVQPGLPRQLAGRLRIQTVADTLYATAIEAFETTRLPVREIETGRIYLLDLKAEAGAPASRLRVVRADANSQGKDQERGGALATTAPAFVGAAVDHGLMTLTRFAARETYAPKRLRAPLAGVARMPVSGFSSDRLVAGADVTAAPLASWRSGNGLYVTAIRLQNKRRQQIELDPRQLRGDWLAVTLHHGVLGPMGAASDTTAAYLVSDRRFEEAAAPWLD